MCRNVDKPIRVLQIGIRNQFDGVGNFMMNYFCEIDKSKVQCDFLIPGTEGSPYDDQIKKIGGKIHYFSYKDDGNIFKFLKDLNRFFKENKYDIVHCSDAGLGFLYLMLARKNGVKVRIAHSHASDKSEGFKGMLAHMLRRVYVGNANVYFACSEEAGRYLFGRKKYIIIRNSVNCDKFRYNKKDRRDIRNEFNIAKDDILIGNVGRLCEVKNQEFILRWMEKLPKQFKLMIVGDGEYRKKFEKYINDKGLVERVFLVYPRKDINRFYSAFDVFVLPSLHEGLPIVGIEAQLTNLPCVFSDTVSKNEKISSRAYFVNNKKAEDWIRIIKTISSDGVREKIKVDRAKYDISRTAKELEELYFDLVKGVK